MSVQRGVQGVPGECAKGCAMSVQRGVQGVQDECKGECYGCARSAGRVCRGACNGCAKGDVEDECARVRAVGVQGGNGECAKGCTMAVQGVLNESA